MFSVHHKERTERRILNVNQVQTGLQVAKPCSRSGVFGGHGHVAGKSSWPCESDTRIHIPRHAHLAYSFRLSNSDSGSFMLLSEVVCAFYFYPGVDGYL